VGGGFYSGFARLPISEAWELFGEGNGAAGLQQMRDAIGRYRHEPISPREDPVIGCIFVRDTRFFAPDAITGPPPDFAPNVVQGKGYDLADSGYAAYFLDAIQRLTGLTVDIDLSEPWHRAGPVYGDPRLQPQRLGQQAFKGVVLDAYGHRCAITGAKIRPVLQAAHILPLPNGGQHRLDNGLLLRSDVHIMFDRGYLSVDPQHRLLVSPRLREDFGNGEEFYSRHGRQISVPARTADRPNREFLQWHVEKVFHAG
jgi:putative restriction endonuclease